MADDRRNVPRTETVLSVRVDRALGKAAAAEALSFLRSCPCNCYLQRPDWPEICPPAARHRYLILRVRDGQRLVGLGLARLSRLAPGRYLASLRRGPATATLEDLRSVLPAFARALRGMGGCSLVFNPRWSGDAAISAVAEIASALGARQLPFEDQSLHCATALVDLSGNEADLFARLKSRGRRQIRRALADGVSIRPAQSLEEARAFDPILSGFLSRRGLGAESIPPVDHMWRMTRDQGAFLLAWHENRPVAGNVMIEDGDRAFWLVIASIDGPSRPAAGYPLVWEALRIAQRQGFHSYDMAGAPPYHLMAGNRIPEDMVRRHQFKTAFATVEVPLVPAWVLPLRRPDHDILFALRRRYRRWRARRGVRT